MSIKRRMFLTALVAAPVAYAVAKRPQAVGGAHDQYFGALQAALVRAGLFRPTLVIDRQRLAHNIERLKAHLPSNKNYRIVAKSLPSLQLIQEVRSATGSNRLMVFHQPHINYLADKMPDAQMLLGKPMPIGAAQRFFKTHKARGQFNPSQQIEWLVDSPETLKEYRALARIRQLEGGGPMRLNLELDVGLHRGGFRNAQDVGDAIRTILAEPDLQFSGFMGYEAHVAKMPEFLGGPAKALEKSMLFYGECLEAARAALGTSYNPASLTLNAGGSNTYQMYSNDSPNNELAVGSALVKPTDFDTNGLLDHLPAAFIATPVLKALPVTEIPGIENFSGLLRAWDPNTARAFFIYGGYWLANPESPPGLQRNNIYGHSTNQEMLNGSMNVRLEAGDFVFLRPHQSESVFLQFGDIAVYDNGAIVDTWPVFPEGEKEIVGASAPFAVEPPAPAEPETSVAPEEAVPEEAVPEAVPPAS